MPPRSVVGLSIAHLTFAAFVLAGLFLTVHNRQVDAEAFETTWVETGVHQDPWTPLVRTWGEEGWLAHGGLWRLNEDPEFRRWIDDRSVDIEPWMDPETFDPEVPHYYRSNTALFVLPLVATRAALSPLVSEDSRLPNAIHSQLLLAAAAVATGLLVHRLSRISGADRGSAVALGLAGQLVFQTNAINLAAYWRHFPQQLFVIGLALFLLAIALGDDRRRLAGGLRLAAVLAMAVADLPHTAATLAAWAIAAGLLDRREFRPDRLWRTLTPVVAVGVVAAAQFLVAIRTHPEAVFVGSGPLFRSGLDGDLAHYRGLLDGYGKLLVGPVLEGAGVAGTGVLLWGVAILAIPLTLLAASRVPRLRPSCLPLAVGGGGFLLFASAFSNAFAIHPFAYSTLLLAPAIAAIFGSWAGSLEAATGRGRTIALLATAAAIFIAMSQLREFAVAYPIASDQRLIPTS